MKNFKTGIAIYDLHYPFHNVKLFNNILKVIKKIKPDVIVLGGDNMDMTPLSHWLGDQSIKIEGKRIKEDYYGFDNDIMNPIEKLLDKNSRKIWLNGNHECLDDKTELLTKRGYINHTKIKDYDEVLSINTETDLLEWVGIDKIIRYEFDGFLNRLKSSGIDLLATDNHKILYKTKYGKEYKFSKINDLTKTRYRIPTNGLMDKKEFDISDNLIKIIAWLLTDGHIGKNGYVGFSQRKSKVHLIENILKGLKLEYNISERQRDIKYICGVKLKKKPQISCGIGLNRENSNYILEFINKDKSIPDWVDELSKRQFDIFLNSLIDGDGSRHKSKPETAWMMYGKKDFLDKLQPLCIQNGYNTSLSAYREKDYRLNICPRKDYSFDNINKIEKKKYNGVVWDLTVKNHNFLIRRNGKCHFTGNCWVNKAIDATKQGQGYWEVEENLHLKNRGWEEYEYGKSAKVGKMYFIHGEYTNQYHAQKTVNVFEKNVIYGHAHTMQTFTKVTPLDNSAHSGISLPCACDLNPHYRKNRPNAWVNGFGVFYYQPNGNFNMYPIVANKGNFIFNNKLYK